MPLHRSLCVVVFKTKGSKDQKFKNLLKPSLPLSFSTQPSSPQLGPSSLPQPTPSLPPFYFFLHPQPRRPLGLSSSARPNSFHRPNSPSPSFTLADGWGCRMDLPGPTTSVGTRTDYSVGPWDYPACTTRHLKAWSTRTTQE
jgi:hypothetical protein